jgi:putative transposase
VGLGVAGAHRNDFRLLQETIDSMPLPPPPADPAHTDDGLNLCLDKGDDYPEVREQVESFGWSAHIRSRGEEKQAKGDIPDHRARRWVVERTHAWMHRFRRLLVRWEKKAENYVAMPHLACAWHAYRAAGVAV